MILYDKGYFALFFISYISMTCIYIYLYMLVCCNCSFWHKYWVWDMVHDIQLVYCLSTCVCQVGFSSDVLDNSVAMSTGTSDTIGWTSIVHWDDSLTEMLHVTVL